MYKRLRTRGGNRTRTSCKAHKILSLACLPIPPPRLQLLVSSCPKVKSTGHGAWIRRAKDGVRTRDLDLGKVALYQLSYFRIVVDANIPGF